jgi:hypothetical protein
MVAVVVLSGVVGKVGVVLCGVVTGPVVVLSVRVVVVYVDHSVIVVVDTGPVVVGKVGVVLFGVDIVGVDPIVVVDHGPKKHKNCD